MPQKVVKCGIKREKGYFYFIDKSGDVSRMKSDGSNPQKLSKCGIRPEKGFFYYVNDEGDVSRIQEGELDKYPQIKEAYDIWKGEEEEKLRQQIEVENIKP